MLWANEIQNIHAKFMAKRVADLDECAITPEVCDANAVCSNIPIGSFTCTCNPGFAGDGLASSSARCSGENLCIFLIRKYFQFVDALPNNQKGKCCFAMQVFNVPIRMKAFHSSRNTINKAVLLICPTWKTYLSFSLKIDPIACLFYPLLLILQMLMLQMISNKSFSSFPTKFLIELLECVQLEPQSSSSIKPHF